MNSPNEKVMEFKQRVAAEWTGAAPAEAWQKHHPGLLKQFGVLTQKLIEVADPKDGMSVLDLASGTGEPALQIAGAVAPTGSVTATDLNGEVLKMLLKNAASEGITNIRTEIADADSLPFENATFDLVTSRFGIMFVAETQKALEGIRSVLKPGGKAVFMAWGPPAPGSYFGAIAMPYVKRLSQAPDMDGPGPMRFAEPEKLAGLLRQANYSDVQEMRESVETAFAGSPEELLQATFELAAPFRRMAGSLSESDNVAAKEEALAQLGSLYRDGNVHVTAPVVIVSGRA